MEQSILAIKKKPKPIRDPVHNYIATTPVELSVIDRPEFQRLRFISQNSSAYLTYPSNNGTRFSHSLGVMHLSGEMFVRALENATAETLINFLGHVEYVVLKHEHSLGLDPVTITTGWSGPIGNTCRFVHQPQDGNPLTIVRQEGGERCGPFRVTASSEQTVIFERDPLYLINTMWQVVRLCGLIHDAGHLPMSHLFEDAIDAFKAFTAPEKKKSFQETEEVPRERQYEKLASPGNVKEFKANASRKIHETRGLLIFDGFFGKEPYPQLLYQLAKTVLLFSPRSAGPEEDRSYQVLRCLHGIIDGDLDADRMDYCLRDPRASGLEFGAVDVERILNNLVLCEEDNKFYLVPTDKALPAIESFFHQRFLIYKYLVYHHSVVRMDGVIKEIVRRLLEQAYSKNRECEATVALQDLLDEFSFFVRHPPIGSNHFLPDHVAEIYEDAWFRTLLTRIAHLLRNNGRRQPELPSWVQPLALLIETFLYRRPENLYSAWKRDTDFLATYQEAGIDDDTVKEFRPLTVGDNNARKQRLSGLINSLKEKLEPEFIVIHRQLAPKICSTSDDECLKMLVGGRLDRITNISPYIFSLVEVASQVPDIHISFLGKDLKDKSRSMECCQNALRENLRQYFKEVLAEERPTGETA